MDTAKFNMLQLIQIQAIFDSGRCFKKGIKVIRLTICWAKSMWRPMSREADLPVRLEPSAGASR